MTRDRAIRLARAWSEGNYCSLRESEVQEFHKMCLAALLEQERKYTKTTVNQYGESCTCIENCGTLTLNL